MNATSPLAAAVTPLLRPKSHKVTLEDLELTLDIGFHDFEVGHPQRVLATVDVTLDLALWPQSDTQADSWDYDILRTTLLDLTRNRRFNLQETLVAEIFDFLAARPGVKALTVTLKKPDVYPDAKSVGVTLTSHE